MKIKIISGLILLLAIVCGCQDNRKQLDGICNDLVNVSKMTDDCHKMAEHLAPVTERFKTIMDKLDKDVPDVSEQQAYFDSASLCLRTYLEISTGTCKDDPEVKSHLYAGSNQ